MRGEFIIARRELKAMLREKSFVLIILLELLLVSASGLLSVGYVILTSPESSGMMSKLSNLVSVGIVTQTKEPYAEAFSPSEVRFAFYEDLNQAREDFKSGLVDAIVSGDLYLEEKPSRLTVYLPSNSPKVDLTRLSLKRVLVNLEDKLRKKRMSEFTPESRLIEFQLMRYEPQARYIEVYFVFTLPLLLFLPCIVSGSLAIDSLTQDFESKSILTLVSAPLSRLQIVVGKALGSFLLSMTQCVLWLGLMSMTSISPGNHIPILVFCGMYTLFFINVGGILALHLRKMRSSQIIYTFFSMLAISLFSPIANINKTLIELSPSSTITRLSLGASILDFTWQFTAVFALTAASTILLIKSSRLVDKP
jgi:ABC-2 type transport system permease protein